MVNTTACDFLKVSENKIEKVVSKTCFGLKSGHICYRFFKQAELTHFAFFVLFCSTMYCSGGRAYLYMYDCSFSAMGHLQTAIIQANHVPCAKWLIST